MCVCECVRVRERVRDRCATPRRYSHAVSPSRAPSEQSSHVPYHVVQFYPDLVECGDHGLGAGAIQRVPLMWQIQDSQGRILAVTFRENAVRYSLFARKRTSSNVATAASVLALCSATPSYETVRAGFWPCLSGKIP